jgi:hypothetical protein
LGFWVGCGGCNFDSSPSALQNDGSKEIVSPLDLHEQFLQEQLQGHLAHDLMNFVFIGSGLK